MPAKIRVSAIQRLCVNDGPGVRTVVFLKGCYLECPWCCNPEAIHYDIDELYNKGTCKYPAKSVVCRNCELYGGRSLKIQCPLNSFEKTYTDYDVDELYSLLIKDEQLFRENGGVTFSGGEPILQARAIKPLLEKLKRSGIHIAFETTLYAPCNHYEAVKEFVDYWLVDLKFQYGYIRNQDYNIGTESFETNLSDLQKSHKDTLYRMVIMAEVLTKTDAIIEEMKIHHVDNVELLGYHALAENKYIELKKTFHRFKMPTKDELLTMCEALNTSNIKARFIMI